MSIIVPSLVTKFTVCSIIKHIFLFRTSIFSIQDADDVTNLESVTDAFLSRYVSSKSNPMLLINGL